MKLARRDRRTRANIASLRHYDAAFRVGTRHGDRETSRRCSSLRCSLKAMLLYASEMVERDEDALIRPPVFTTRAGAAQNSLQM
jgi:hypothetical protein